MNPVLNEATLSENSGNEGGKSNAFLYFTHDRRYIIKTLHSAEVDFLLRNQSQFNRHFKQRSDGFSYIAKILGLYKLSDCARGSINLLIMENIVIPGVSVSAFFDLKGSKKNRSSLQDSKVSSLDSLSPMKIYKDLDFLQVVKCIELEQSEFVLLIEQLVMDVEFLEELKVMDYSMLVAISKTPKTGGRRELNTSDGRWRVHIGIIDCLQKFNSKKKLEVLSNRLSRPVSDPLDISCVNHHLYAERFLQFMFKILKIAPTEKPQD